MQSLMIITVKNKYRWQHDEVKISYATKKIYNAFHVKQAMY